MTAGARVLARAMLYAAADGCVPRSIRMGWLRRIMRAQLGEFSIHKAAEFGKGRSRRIVLHQALKG